MSYPRKLVEATFAQLAKIPQWKPENEYWWNFYFTANSKESLVALAQSLSDIGIRAGRPVPGDKPGQYIMAARQFTRHTVESLDMLNTKFSQLADHHGVRFDAEDIGPLDS